MKPRRKIGAPPKRAPRPGERFQLGVRVTPEMKHRLEMAAEESGRSLSQEAELRLERSFDREQILAEALSLKFGRAGAGILLVLALTMEHAGRAYLIDEAWRDVPKGAGIEDVDPMRWHRVLSMHWADDPASREIGMLSMLLVFAMLPPIKVKPEELVAYLKTATSVLQSLRMKDLPPAHGAFRQDIETIRSLMSPDMLARSDTSIVNDDVAQALQHLSNLLGPAIAQFKYHI